jgi:hypothetical protein
MIFRRYYTIESSKNADLLRRNFLGQHLTIHNLDFEITEKGDSIKVIPHAENDDQVYTLPITRLRFVPKGNGTVIRMLSKPRRIDIGGPYLLMIFVVFAIIAGILLKLYGSGEYDRTSYIIMGVAAAIFALLWLRMEQGYFDYIRKIKKWVREHA